MTDLLNPDYSTSRIPENVIAPLLPIRIARLLKQADIVQAAMAQNLASSWSKHDNPSKVTVH